MLPIALLAPLPCGSAPSSADSSTPELLAEPGRLGDQTDLRGEQRVVDELDLLAGSDRTDVQHRVAVAATAPDGRASTAPSVPPTHSVTRPAAMSCGPPLTGASTTSTPRAGASAASVSAVRGLPVVCSTSTEPARHGRDQRRRGNLADLVVGEDAHHDDVGAVGDVGRVRDRGGPEFG